MTNPSPSFDDLLLKIRRKLPLQNPLHSFVHNNILQMFEGNDFHTAVHDAGRLYQATSYWPIENYLQKYEEGKILEIDIKRGISHYSAMYSGIPILEELGLGTQSFYHLLMFSDLKFNDVEVQPEITNQSLWDKCQRLMSEKTLFLKRTDEKLRAKEYWEKNHNMNFALSVNPFMIRMISSYLDQGQSFWMNPFVNKGFWYFFSYDLIQTKNFLSGWQSVLVQKIESYQGLSSEEIILKEMELTGLPVQKWDAFIVEILFDLKGWSGMVNKLETEPWQATVKAPNIKLADYICAYLLIETSIDDHLAGLNSIDLTFIRGRKIETTMRGFELSLGLYQIIQNFKLGETWVDKFSDPEILNIINWMDTLENEHKIRLWHEAFEHHFYYDALSAIVSHSHHLQKEKDPKAQVLFCIDDREESMRRHLEEVDAEIKTYGVVGFFGIDMKFSSFKSKRLIAQCPPVIVPSRIVREVPKDTRRGVNYSRLTNFFGGSGLSLYYHSRTLFRGFFSTLLLGTASIFPMFLQVFFPKESDSFKKSFKQFVNQEPLGELHLDSGETGYGYSKMEMAKIVHNILKMCGFTHKFSPLIIMMGHGSTSTNNPFRQAYGCGACGGNAGIPNSRAFAQMANDPMVRQELTHLGVTIPETSYFISAFHDTCTDEIQILDSEKLPTEFLSLWQEVKSSLNKASGLNAFERCQRFGSKDQVSNPEEALKHVKERAMDLAQPRPEYGHSTNALAIVGKRNLTRGLFLNRRSFLLSYDWETDPDGLILEQVVLGGIPVCVNINMDYYFSSVDNENYGCGSKLPLNLTSLLGVMTGSQGDLRIGLAKQMVEIHEPIRNMSIIESPLKRVKDLFNKHPRLKNLLYHHWFRLVVHDPETNLWSIFTKNDFVPLEVDSDHMKHFTSSMDRLIKDKIEEDFSEIDRD